LEALQVKLQTDTQKQVNEQAEALKALEQKLCGELDNALKLMKQEREEALRQNSKDRREALQVQLRDMEHVQKEKQSRDEAQQIMQQALENLEIKVDTDVEQRLKAQANALKTLEQKMFATQDNRSDKQEVLLPAQLREVMEHMEMDKQLRDEARRTMQQALEVVEIKLHKHTEKQEKDQEEALKAMEQKLRSERSERDDALEAFLQNSNDTQDVDAEKQTKKHASIEALKSLEQQFHAAQSESLKMIREEREEDFSLNNKDRQKELQVQTPAMPMSKESQLQLQLHGGTEKQIMVLAEALNALETKLLKVQEGALEMIRQEKETAKERKLRDEAQRATQNGLEALQVKLHRLSEKQGKDQADALKALEQRLRADLQTLGGEHKSKMKDSTKIVLQDLVQATSPGRMASPTTELRGKTQTLEQRLDQLEKKMEMVTAPEKYDQKHEQAKSMAKEEKHDQAFEAALLAPRGTLGFFPPPAVEEREMLAQFEAHLQKKCRWEAPQAHDMVLQAAHDNESGLQGIQRLSHLLEKEDIEKASRSPSRSPARSPAGTPPGPPRGSFASPFPGVAKDEQAVWASGDHGILWKLLTHVTKRVDKLEAGLEQEHLTRLAAKGELNQIEKSISQLRCDISQVGEAHNEMKAELQETRRALVVHEPRSGSERSVCMLIARVQSEVHTSNGTLRHVLGEVADHVCTLEETVERLDQAHYAFKDEVLTTGKTTEDLKVAVGVLKLELNDHKLRSEKAAKEFEEEMRQALGETHSLQKKMVTDMEALSDTCGKFHGAVRIAQDSLVSSQVVQVQQAASLEGVGCRTGLPCTACTPDALCDSQSAIEAHRASI